MFGWFKRWICKKPIPQRLTATNQGRAGHCIRVEVRLLEQEPDANGQRNARVELVEATSGLPLQFAGHEATVFGFLIDPENNTAQVNFQLGGLDLKFIPLSEAVHG